MTMVDREQLFKKALEIKFTQEWGENKATEVSTDITSKKAKYLRLGTAQSPRKREFEQYGKEIAAKRGIPGYDPKLHLGGIPLGQRQITPYVVSSTDTLCDGDDLHFVNNAAMQQMWDDIRRTVIVGMDLAHETLEKRLGKEVTPETINHYLEVLNHAMPGAAVVQEMMVETHPGLVDDCYVKIFTGDDELADEIDKRFLIDINKQFGEEKAAQIKAAIGKTTWQAVHVPTIVVRTCDGATTSRWTAMQIGMSFIAAYRMCAGEAAVADLAYAAKHAALVGMGDMLPARRARGPNEPGGLQFGYLADIVQADRVTDDKVKASLEVVAAGAMLYDQIWLGSYMSGGVGFTQYATAAYTNNILDDFSYYGYEYAVDKYGGPAQAPATLETVKDIATETAIYAIEQYEYFPTLLEDQFGGSQRAAVVAAAAGIATGLATGNSQAGLSGWYLAQYLLKEAEGRLGFFGYDLQDQCGAANVFSYQSDEGLPLELRGPNYPNYAMNVGHQGEYAGIASSGHIGRGDAFVVNPLVKVAFADPLLNFDFTQVRKEFAKGAVREFDRCAGERALILPAK